MTLRAEPIMGTLVTIQVTSAAHSSAIDRAFGWFRAIEECCSRFNESSELRRLTARAGEALKVSPILFEAVRFALQLAQETDGAFDPTVGARMESRGFNREYRSGRVAGSAVSVDGEACYRDVEIDPERQTIALRRPLILDLGAVAKGLAVDMAARELAEFRDFAIDAGGDLFFSGRNPKGEPWSVGIRHPRNDGEIIETLRISGQAVCTSGDYERRVAGDPSRREHHILDPRTGHSPQAVASATVVADSAMLADALATAAFVLGPAEGIGLLERTGVGGLIFTADLHRSETRGLSRAA